MTITAASTASAPSTSPAVDRHELEARVKAMYREVTETPEADFHFEMGRALAESARDVSETYGVKGVSLLAIRR